MRQQKEIVEKYEVLAATEWDLTFAANGTMYGTGLDAPGTLEGRWAGDRCAWIETYDYGMDRRRLDKNLRDKWNRTPSWARAPDFEVVVTGKLVGDGIDVDFYSNKGRKRGRAWRSRAPSFPTTAGRPRSRRPRRRRRRGQQSPQ